MSTENAPAADLEEALEALEMRALERQKRLEAAMLQVFHSTSIIMFQGAFFRT